VANPDSDDRKKKEIAGELKGVQQALERLVVKLTAEQALNEASYLRKAVAEIKRAMRTL